MVNRCFWWAACVMAGCLAACAARAQQGPAVVAPVPAAMAASAVASPAPVPLAEALHAAWQRAVSAREAEGQRRQADAEQAAAARWWAAPPALELRHRDDRWQTAAGRRETEAGVVWPLWLPGQRSATGAVAEAAVASAQAHQHAARLALAGQVRETAWHLAEQEAHWAQSRAQAGLLQRLAGDVQRRVRAGDLAPVDALAAQAEALAAATQAAQARQRVKAALAQWTELTGLVVPAALPAADPAPQAVEPGPEAAADSPFSVLLDTHPEAQLAQWRLAHAERRLALVQAAHRDAPELSLAWRQDQPGQGQPRQHSTALGLRLPLGTADRNQPRLAAALSEVDIAHTTGQRVRERLAAQAALARDAVQAATAQAAQEAERAHLLRERAALLDRAFQAGEGALPELLRALTAAAQAELAAARSQAALGLARARLQQASGQLP